MEQFEKKPSDIIEVETALKEATAAHEQYRKTGFTIMSPIIGLSAGTLYLFKDVPLAYLFFVVILVSLHQQFTFYLGSQGQARSLHHWFRALVFNLNKDEKNRDKALQLREKEWKLSQISFDQSDFLSGLALHSFIVLSICGIWKIAGRNLGLISSAAALATILILWRLARRTKNGFDSQGTDLNAVKADNGPQT